MRASGVVSSAATADGAGEDEDDVEWELWKARARIRAINSPDQLAGAELSMDDDADEDVAACEGIILSGDRDRERNLAPDVGALDNENEAEAFKEAAGTDSELDFKYVRPDEDEDEDEDDEDAERGEARSAKADVGNRDSAVGMGSENAPAVDCNTVITQAHTG
jgi:hypothetical protein